MSDWDIINDSDIEQEVEQEHLSDDDFVMIKEDPSQVTSLLCSGKNTSKKEASTQTSQMKSLSTVAESSSTSEAMSRTSPGVETRRRPIKRLEEPLTLEIEEATKSPKIQFIDFVEYLKDLDYPGLRLSNGLVSFKQHPRTWFDHMTKPNWKTSSYQSLDIRIMQSVAMIYRLSQEMGLLRLIFWSSLNDWRSTEDEFWEKFRQAALGLLEEKPFLVHLEGKLWFVDRLAGDAKFVHEQTTDGADAYCLIEKSETKWLKYSEGKKMASSLSNSEIVGVE